MAVFRINCLFLWHTTCCSAYLSRTKNYHGHGKPLFPVLKCAGVYLQDGQVKWCISCLNTSPSRYGHPMSPVAGIGVLSCLAFLLSDRPIGCSTAFVKARGLIGKAINPEGCKKGVLPGDYSPGGLGFDDYSRDHYRCIYLCFHLRAVSHLSGSPVSGGSHLGIIRSSGLLSLLPAGYFWVLVHAGQGAAPAVMGSTDQSSSRLPVLSRHAVFLSGGLQPPC